MAADIKTVVPEIDPIITVSVPASVAGVEEFDGLEDRNGLGVTGTGAWVNTALCHVEKEGIRFLVPISQEGEFCSAILVVTTCQVWEKRQMRCYQEF